MQPELRSVLHAIQSRSWGQNGWLQHWHERESFERGKKYKHWAHPDCGFPCEPVVDRADHIYSAGSGMTLGIAVGAYLVVHLLGVYLLRASGVATDLFGRFRNVPDLPEPKQLSEFTAFVETHSFWDTEEDQALEAIDEFELQAVFWNERRRRTA